MKNVLVTGATGFVGSRLCKELVDNDYNVTALHRKSSDISKLKQLPIKLVCGDITDKQILIEAMQGIDVVFHIAALFREAKHPDSVYWDVNYTGTQNVLEAARERGVKKVVHCSTIGVHSHIPNPPADENEEYRPGDVYQESKCAGEKLAKEWFQSGKINGVVVRPAMIWGPGDKRTFKLFKGISEGKLPLIGTGETFCHWVIVDDLVRGFRLAAERTESDGQTYIIAGDRPVTMKYLFETIARCFNVKPYPIKVPAWPIQMLGSFVELICKPFGIEPPIYRRRVDFFTKSRAFNCEKAIRELGYRPTRTFEEEVSYIKEWYEENGWLKKAA